MYDNDPDFYEAKRIAIAEKEYNDYLQDRQDQRIKMISDSIYALANSISSLVSRLP